MKYIITISLLLLCNIMFGQNDCPECEKFKIVGVYDFGPPPGGNWIILLLTVTEDLDSSFDPHYSDLFFISSDGDTITKPTGPSLSLPQIQSDTIPYVMELNTDLSNQDFPIDFDGDLVIRTPTGSPCPNVTWCNLSYSKLTSNTLEPQLHNSPSIIYPNPAVTEIRINTKKDIRILNIYNFSGGLIKTISKYKGGEQIDLEGIKNEVILLQFIYHDNKIETQQLLII